MAFGPQPAYPQPASPQPTYVQPPSSPGLMMPRNRAAAYSTAPGTRGVYAGRIQLDPQQLVAPVGSEVVLRAGLCGDDGYLIKKQPIEWSLSRDSVGNFVEVDEFKKPFWRRMFHKPPEKRSGDYAIGRTSTAPQVLTRGTVDPRDDIQIAKGQTWISLTSAAEGVSHITAVAPSAAGWGERRESSTIHWIDGRWQLPPPSSAPVGRPRQITTNVRRSTTGDPIQGWVVRYEIQDNAAANLAANLANAKRALDVVTDEHGNASVNVSPSVSGPGITPIGIQVFRIGNRVGDYDRILVGQGQTSITWTDSLRGSDPYPVQPAPSVPADNTPTIPAAVPQLNVDISGPTTVTAGRDATYQITVDNVGTTSVANSQLSVEVPNGMQFVRASSPGNLYGSDVRWDLQTVPAQRRASHQVTLRANGAGPFRVCARTNSGGTASGSDCIDTVVSEVNTPSPPTPADTEVRLSMEGPDEAFVGQQIRYRVTLTNPSKFITRVIVRDEFDPGLGHIQGGSPIEYPLNLGPGEVKVIPLDFTAKTPGQQCHTLTVTSNDSTPKSERACVRVTPRGSRPGISQPPDSDPFPTGQVRVVPKTFRNGVQTTENLPVVQVGEPIKIEFDVQNTGSTVMRNLTVVDEFDPNLFPILTTQGENQNETNQNRLVWRIEQLEPGQSRTFGVETKPARMAASSCHALSVYSEGRSIASREACVQVARPSSPVDIRLQPPSNAATSMLSPLTPVAMRVISNRTATELSVPPTERRRSGASASDNLRVTVSDLGDPGYVNQRLTYVVVVRNNQKTSDRNVVLTVTLPEGARYDTSINPPMIRARKTTPDRRTVEFLPITELRGDESATFRIVATSEQAGTGIFRAEVISARTQLPVVTTEETTFFVK